jgi:hypothetical protein
MALTGKPTVVEPRAAREPDSSPSLRPTQQAIAAIRERLRLIEAETNALLVRVDDLVVSGVSADVAALQAQIDALRFRIQALEEESPTEWYVNDVLIGTRNRVNFLSVGDIVVTGEDDAIGEQVIISFSSVTGISIQRGRAEAAGRDVTLGGVVMTLDVERGAARAAGRDVGIAA